MKNIFVILTLLLAIIAVSCVNQKPGQVGCTMDAKICPDGSAVGRQGPSCEFAPCPSPPPEKPIPVEQDGGIGLTNPYVQYVGESREKCAATDWLCPEGSSQFFDDSGCGCKADEPKKYVSKDLDECSRIRYMCTKNYVPFTDEEGCGCEYTFGEDAPPEGKLQVIKCTPEQKAAEACTLEYMPVCGWFNQDIKCIKYPCAQTYGNACGACADEKVESYTIGECPSENDTVLR